MPILDWIGKKQVINHDKEVPFRLLKRVHSLSVGESENLIIKGDNLEALKALLPYYCNKVKCIYIDPPYNTGNENWIYNDKVNSPEMKKWLGRVVGSEGEDLSRHDKWLCMMYPRLKLLRELLSDDGVIFVSIDDDEVHHLRMLMDEVFGERNFIADIIWQKKTSPQNDAKYFSDNHDFIIVYAKKRKQSNRDLGFSIKLLERLEKHNANYTNPDNDPRGFWMRGDFSVKTYSAEYDYEIVLPSGKKVKPPRGRCWMTSKERYKELVKDNRIWFGKNGDSIPAIKRFLSEVKQGITPLTIWFANEVGSNSEGRRILKEIFPEVVLPFENPKPIQLINRILKLSTDKDDIILDSFAGSGTTAHAVLELNKEDGGNRKFILVEMEDDIARKVTAERVKRVIKGYTYKNNKGEDVKVEGPAPDRSIRGQDPDRLVPACSKQGDIQVGFQFMNLDTELFDAHGLINDNIDYTDLARYIFFSETKLDLKEKAMKDYFIGERNGTEYYLIYKQGKENILNEKTASKLKGPAPASFKQGPVLKGFNSGTDKEKIVYADNCTLDSDTLAEQKITFKQIPYEVRGF